MQPDGLERGANFWWRAAEPIPARPVALIDPEALPNQPFLQPPEGMAGAGGRQAADATQASGDPRARKVRAGPADLGDFRPMLQEAGRNGRRLQRTTQRSSRVGSTAARGRQPRLIALVAAIVGALGFAATSDFGARTRYPAPMAGTLESLLVQAGFGVNEISIRGHHHTLDSEVFKALGSTKSTLIGLDVAGARRRIEALAWVEQAAIERDFPDKLRIEIRERAPFAIWQDGAQTVLVDQTGRVLARLGSFVPPDLPRIAGEGAPEAAAELLGALAADGAIRSHLALARYVGRRRWDLELDNGSRVMLPAGPVAPSLARLAALATAIGAPGQGRRIIDLRLARLVAISVAAEPPVQPPDAVSALLSAQNF